LDKTLFKQTLKKHLKAAGLAQASLATHLNIEPGVLSRKLNGANKAYLNKQEVKQIVKALAKEQVISFRIEAIELLNLYSFVDWDFSLEEWNSPPLNKLEQGLDTFEHNQTAKNSSKPPNNLSLSLNTLIGREKELKKLFAHFKKTSLAATSRLITLTGTGGIGKTRLALQLAETLLQSPTPIFKDGIWLVRLESLLNDALLPQQIAAVLELDEPNNDQSLIEGLAIYLEAKSVLLILDNCEHLINACSELIIYLLSQCPRLQILVTSRETLKLPGETVFKVPSLTIPDQNVPLAKIEEFSAIALFRERAQAGDGSFTLTDNTGAGVVQICRYLAGIPLAIELAASRITVLSIREIVDSLKSNFLMLGSNNRFAPPRQQTIETTINWSYDLLSPKEQRLFRRLAIFVGGWDLEAAQAVAGDRQDLTSNEILELTSKLIDASLVIKEEIFEKARYRLLDIFRQYAYAKLVQHGEELLISKTHSNWCIDLVEIAEPYLRGAEQSFWLDRLEIDHFNFRAAMDWLLTQGNKGLEEGLRLSSALGWFWWVRGYTSEGTRWLDLFLAGIVKNYPSGELIINLAVQAKALHMAGVLRQHQGDYGQATANHEQSLALRKRLNDRRGVSLNLHNLGVLAQFQNNYPQSKELYLESLAIKTELGAVPVDIAPTLHNLGIVERFLGNYAQGKEYLEASLALRTKIGDKEGIASCLDNLGAVAEGQGYYDEAQQLREKSLKLREEIGNKFGIALSKHNLALCQLRQKNYIVAKNLFNESLAISRELGDKQGIAETIYGLGDLAQAEGDYSLAEELYRESMLQSFAIGDKENLVYCVESLAELAVIQEQSALAAQLFGFAEKQRDIMRCKMFPQAQLKYNTSRAVLEQQIEHSQLEALLLRGRVMNLGEAVKLASINLNNNSNQSILDRASQL